MRHGGSGAAVNIIHNEHVRQADRAAEANTRTDAQHVTAEQLSFTVRMSWPQSSLQT